ncbi:CYTH domain-containing protein [Symbiobacterium terraclitae]|uniref:CYTH domain-containing protein n=1 Tax=Symbiobacterium terraclitae TaxID=557451 RepID=UPI0035B54B74
MEVEIKLHVPPTVPGGPAALFARLAEEERLAGYELGPVRSIQLRDTYFDTDKGALAAAASCLRLRHENGRALVTLKETTGRQGALAARAEYEVPLDPDRLTALLARIRLLIGPVRVPFAAFAAGRPAGPLLPVLDVHTERLERSVGAVATLALDRVTYPGLAPEPYYDIEIEAAPDMPDVAVLRALEADLQQLAGGHLIPSGQSKLERGLGLRNYGEWT